MNGEKTTVGPAAIVLGIGLERLVSALMTDGLAPYTLMRWFVGIAFTAAGGALFAVATVTRFQSRHRRS
jgi:hypothetical protein